MVQPIIMAKPLLPIKENPKETFVLAFKNPYRHPHTKDVKGIVEVAEAFG